ncbi:hypothetical protein TNCV_1221281 [Trichonephila clavipes]|nr:hypothetical protein TNCV_1221281 [Trichonephila clavipes]
MWASSSNSLTPATTYWPLCSFKTKLIQIDWRDSLTRHELVGDQEETKWYVDFVSFPVRAPFLFCTPNFDGDHPEGGQLPPISISLPSTSREELRLDGYLEYPPRRKGTMHLQTSMPSPSFKPSPYGASVGVNNHYTGLGGRNEPNCTVICMLAGWRSWFVAGLVRPKLRVRPRPKSVDFHNAENRQRFRIARVQVPRGRKLGQNYIAVICIPFLWCRTQVIPVPEECTRTATAGSDVVQSGRPIFDDFFQHLWPYIGNNASNVVFQMVKRLWLIRRDQ